MSAWTFIDPEQRIQCASYSFPGGLSRTTVVDLGAGMVLVYSPGKELVAAAPALLDRAETLLILAPSSVHTLGVDAWAARFPNARILASSGAQPRLRKKVAHSAFEDPSSAASDLPEGVAFHDLPSCRTGEIWVSVVSGDAVYWLVCDALMNLRRLPSNPLKKGLMMLYGLRPGLRITPLFRHVVIRDKHRFRAWGVARFANDRRNILVPCHGAVDEAPDFTERVTARIQARYR